MMQYERTILVASALGAISLMVAHNLKASPLTLGEDFRLRYEHIDVEGAADEPEARLQETANEKHS